MRKLKLDLEELAVETFAVDEPDAERGTVEGRLNPSIPPWCLLTRPTDCPCTP